MIKGFRLSKISDKFYLYLYKIKFLLKNNLLPK
jgi:hypothetical protein